MKTVVYLVIILLFFMCFYGIASYEDKYPVSIHSDTVNPDNFLLNSKLYITEGLTERSRRNLMEAIWAINAIKSKADPESQEHIETGIEELREVLHRMESGEFSRRDLNSASITVLNALTYFQIKAAETFILEGQLQRARTAISYGMLHVKNALIHAEGTKKETEIEIYSEMRALVEDTELTKEQMIANLERMLDDLEDLEIEYR